MQRPPSEQTFQIERFNTPTGRMLVVSDDQGRLRAVDWEDHEERMQRLLGRYYRKSRVLLREVSRPSAPRLALDAYFAGELGAIDEPSSNARCGVRCVAYRAEARSATAHLQLRSVDPPRCAPSGSPMAPTPLPSWCRVTAWSARIPH
jgi:hypothetical protein